MTDAREACSKVLQKLQAADGVRGVCIVSRDGLPVLSAWPQSADLDTVSAMGAALMGAAETSLLEFGDRGLETVLVVSEGMRLAVIGVDDELLLLAAMDRDVAIESFDELLHRALKELAQILEEA